MPTKKSSNKKPDNILSDMKAENDEFIKGTNVLVGDLEKDLEEIEKDMDATDQELEEIEKDATNEIDLAMINYASGI